MSAPTPEQTVYADPNPGLVRVGSVSILKTVSSQNGINQLRIPTSSPSNYGIPNHCSNVSVQTSVTGTKTTFRVIWQQPVGDPSYSGAHLHIAGYQGSTSPQRIMSNAKSPAIFTLDSSQEPVQVVVQSTGNHGSADLAMAPTTTAICGRPSFGGYGSGSFSTASNLDKLPDGTSYLRLQTNLRRQLVQVGGGRGGNNLLFNPGFEQSGFWTPGGAITIGTTAANAHTGNNYLDISASTNVQAFQLDEAGNTRYVEISPADTVFLSGYIYLVSIAGSAGLIADVTCETFDKDLNHIAWHNAAKNTGTGAWALVSTTFTAESNAKYMRVYCEINGGGGSPGAVHARFDDVVVRIVSSLDTDVQDGATYARPLSSRINAGRPVIDFSEAIHSNKILDNIADGSTYARVVSSALSSGSVLAAHISNQAVGQITAGATLTNGVVGTNVVFSGWRKISTTTINVPAGTGSVTLTCNQPAQGGGGSGSLFTGIGFSISNGASPSTPQASHTGGSGSFAVTLSSPTSGTGLTLQLYVQGSGTNDGVLTNPGITITQSVVQILNAGSLT